MVLLQVTNVEIRRCRLEETSTSLWTCLASLISLRNLNIRWSTFSFPLQSPPSLPLVKELQVQQLPSDNYIGVIASLPGLTKAGYPTNPFWLKYPDADIAQILKGINQSGASLTHINLDGYYAHQCKVSDSTVGNLCKVMRDQCKSLEVFWLACLAIHEESLVKLVDLCRGIRSMKEIR